MKFVHKRPDRLFWVVFTDKGGPLQRRFFVGFEEAVQWMTDNHPGPYVETSSSYRTADERVKLKHSLPDALIARRLRARGEYSRRAERINVIRKALGVPETTTISQLAKVLSQSDPLIRSMLVETIKQNEGTENE